MDNSSGVGVLDKAVVGPRTRSRPGRAPRRAGRGDRAGPADRAPARGRAGAPPAAGPRHAGPVRPRPPAGRAGRRAPARTGCWPRPARCWPGCATSPARAPSCTGAQGDERVCVAAAERTSGLRDTVPVGAALPMTAGSAAQVLLAWEEPDRLHRGLRGARFTAAHAGRGAPPRLGPRASASARRASPRSRRRSATAPARSSRRSRVSGPIERLTRRPGPGLRRW